MAILRLVLSRNAAVSCFLVFYCLFSTSCVSKRLPLFTGFPLSALSALAASRELLPLHIASTRAAPLLSFETQICFLSKLEATSLASATPRKF